MRRLCTLLFLAGTLGLMLVGCQSGEKKRKTLFVIVDGVTVDNIERIAPATIFDIASVGGYSRGYCGGKVGQYSQTPTISAVGYNNILTGTWVNKHNVSGNTNQNPNYNYWSIFRIAKVQKEDVKTALYSSWTDNRTYCLHGLRVTSAFCKFLFWHNHRCCCAECWRMKSSSRTSD